MKITEARSPAPCTCLILDAALELLKESHRMSDRPSRDELRTTYQALGKLLGGEEARLSGEEGHALFHLLGPALRSAHSLLRNSTAVATLARAELTTAARELHELIDSSELITCPETAPEGGAP